MQRGGQEQTVEFGTVPWGQRMKGHQGSLGHGHRVERNFENLWDL